MNNLKAGIWTSEFLLNLATKIIVAICAIAAIYGFDVDAEKLGDLVGQVIVAVFGIVALLTSAWNDRKYTEQRTALKIETTDILHGKRD